MTNSIETKTYSLESVKAVILVGDPDFGRCTLATRLNRALWPFAGRPALQRLIEHIANQGVRRFVICGSKGTQEVQAALDIPDYLSVEFRFEDLPRGTAGGIRDAADMQQDELVFVFPAAIVSPPDLNDLISAHRNKMRVMTIFFNPSEEEAGKVANDAQIYVCQPEIVDYIPSQGYFDLKENLVPTLVQAGKPICFAQLHRHAGNFRHWDEYLTAVRQYLLSMDPSDLLLHGFQRLDSENDIWCGKNVTIDPSARMMGPLVIGDNSTIGPETLVFGPAMIESDVQIHPNALLSESLIWKESVIGPHCRIQQCLVDEKKTLFSSDHLDHQLILRSKGRLLRMVRSLMDPLIKAGDRLDMLQKKPEDTLYARWVQPRAKTGTILLFLLITGSLLAAYWNPTLIELWRVWIRSDEYSSGLLVPFLAAYIIWDRRKHVLECPIKPFPWAVLILFLVQLLRLAGLLIWSPSVERFSFFLTTGVLLWMVLGFQFMKKLFPVWLYLILMFPLPKMLEWKITVPLQKWASVSAVFCLESLGFNVIREGNIININGTLVAVAEACNGLRMLTAFFVVTGFVVLLSQRRFWEKVLILFSSVPIALLCNTIRLTLTSIAFLYLEADVWEKAFHDYGGLAMMPLALGITLFELWFFSKLIIGPEQQAVRPQIIIRKK